MGVSQRISKKSVWRRQTGLGVPGAATGQVMRRTSSIMQAVRDSFKSQEVVSHHQSTGSSYGVKKTTGKLDGELSCGTYQMFEENMLQAIYTAVAAVGAQVDVTAAVTVAPEGTFTDASAAWLTAGLKVGMIGRWGGWTAGAVANNARNFWITSLTAGVMTGIFLDGTAVVAKASGDSVTFTPVGKVCKIPLTGHLKTYLQNEEFYSDNTISDCFTDVLASQLDYDIPASGNAKFSASFIGLQRAYTGVQVMAAPTAESSNGIVGGLSARLYANNASQKITGLKFSIKNNAAPTPAECGSNASSDVIQDIIEVEGSFTALLRDTVVSSLYEATTEISIIAAVTADQTATSDCKSFIIGAVRLFGDPPDDAMSVSRTYNFTARLNPNGGAALAYDQTIVSIQDSAAV